MRSSTLQLFALLTTVAVMFMALPAALACESDLDARVTFAIDTVGPEPAGDVNVGYTIVPYAADSGEGDDCEEPVDGGCPEDPEDPGDPGDPGDPTDPGDPGDPGDPTDPEPVTGILSVGVGSDEVFELPAGDADFEFELSGYETLVLSRNICGDTTVRATLLSNTPATFSAYIGRWEGDVAAEGALVTLKGRDERMGERFEAEVDAAGQVEIDGVPAGFYELEVLLQLEESYEHIELGFVDLLHDAHLSIRLRSSDDLPNTKITCAAMSQRGNPTANWSVLALFLFVLAQLGVVRGRAVRRRYE